MPTRIDAFSTMYKLYTCIIADELNFCDPSGLEQLLDNSTSLLSLPPPTSPSVSSPISNHLARANIALLFEPGVRLRCSASRFAFGSILAHTHQQDIARARVMADIINLRNHVDIVTAATCRGVPGVASKGLAISPHNPVIAIKELNVVIRSRTVKCTCSLSVECLNFTRRI